MEDHLAVNEAACAIEKERGRLSSDTDLLDRGPIGAKKTVFSRPAGP